MKIELELDDREAETFLIAKTQDINVTKYSSEAKAETIKNAIYDCIYEILANIEMQRELEAKKLEIQKWLDSKRAGYFKEKLNS